jgi:hypothetical protein
MLGSGVVDFDARCEWIDGLGGEKLPQDEIYPEVPIEMHDELNSQHGDHC